MSIGEHIEISATLELRSTLHIGQALARLAEVDLSDTKNEDLAEADIATIQRDASGRPWIPGTTIKGILLDLARRGGAPESAVEAAFGKELHHEKKTGLAGDMVAHAAVLQQCGTVDRRLEKNRDIKHGTFVQSRTRIDGATGTAAEHKLFSQELVARDARFKFRLTLMRGCLKVADPTTEVMLRLLATLEHEGAYFGRGRTDGWGWLKLVSIDSVKITRLNRKTAAIDASDGLREFDAILKTVAPYSVFSSGWCYRVKLSSEDPFFINVGEVDPACYPRRKDPKTGQEVVDKSLLFAARHEDKKPELPGQGLASALRAKAEWVRNIQILRGERQECAESQLLEEDPVIRLFGPTAEEWKRGRQYLSVRKATGLAARLRMLSIEEADANDKVLPSVKLDRFSGAPIDNALFKVKAFVAPSFTAELVLERADEKDRQFLDEVFDALRKGPSDGIFLGAGANRGFGWFNVEVTCHDAH